VHDAKKHIITNQKNKSTLGIFRYLQISSDIIKSIQYLVPYLEDLVPRMARSGPAARHEPTRSERPEGFPGDRWRSAFVDSMKHKWNLNIYYILYINISQYHQSNFMLVIWCHSYLAVPVVALTLTYTLREVPGLFVHADSSARCLNSTCFCDGADPIHHQVYPWTLETQLKSDLNIHKHI